jgi:hypothetical protein
MTAHDMDITRRFKQDLSMMRPKHHCTIFGMLSLEVAQQSFVIVTAHFLP